ncbi:MAG: hypothetical protein WC342_08220 [Methanoregula sp.]|jgi:hypothetical protein
MAKIVLLPTRAFGAEPGIPDVAALAGWIADHRGMAADLDAYRLDVSLAPQLASDIDAPCAGGKFVQDRVLEGIVGLNRNRDTATSEIDAEGSALTGDAAMLAAMKKKVWCALPAPHMLGLTDAYYRDTDEWNEALAGVYRKILRDMRDAGIGGHVLIGNRADEMEIALLSRKNVFFFVPGATSADLEILLETQHEIAVDRSRLDDLFSRENEYDIRRLVILNPDPATIRKAREYLDPDQICCGGYCTEPENPEEYWKDLVSAAWYEK